MIYAYCVDKKIENGSITEYKLKDFEGNIQVLKSGILKSMIAEGTLCVVNLTLTSDKKLRTHSIPTLKNLLDTYNSEEMQKNINHIFSENRVFLGDTDPKDCFLYKHKLFFKKDCLNVLNTSTQEVIQIQKDGRDLFVNNIIYIPNGNYLNMLVEVSKVMIDYMVYSIYQIVYDIYTDNYSIVSICMSSESRKEYLYNHYELGVNDIITLKDKSNRILPYFILHNKSKSNSYLITAHSKEMLLEFIDKIKNFEKHKLKFEVHPYIDGVELELDNYIMKIDKKFLKGTLIRMR